MNETFYLVDNNALTALTASRIRTDFFADRCRVTEDVLWEARDHPAAATLNACTISRTTTSIALIRDIMRVADLSDGGLIDLYRNKGSADPGLIATIIGEQQKDDGLFFRDSWILVTRDRAVTQLARRFEVAVVTPEVLSSAIDDFARED